ncbi:MAG: glycosyl transferase family protein, partial [Pontixanthobacter sp.]
AWQWLVLVQHELLLFAGVFFLIGAMDELAVDLAWLWFRLTGKAHTRTISDQPDSKNLSGMAAVFIPAWQEAAVIGATVSHALSVWNYTELRIYAGCYRNDPATMDAIINAALGDRRLRLVIHDCDGPSTKADCLNRLYGALETDETRLGNRAHMIVLHDAEDMVDPAALIFLDRAICEADLAQIPVLPVPQVQSPWVAGHYCEEFAEAHGKAMVVRDALGAGMPLAGVGCAISRAAIERLAVARPDHCPFAAECLTEDYELGIGVADMGGKAKFIRQRHADGRLVATRACFPATLNQAVRQKTRWVHGIAFQGWDRLGWSGRPAEFWMRLRDRRGPFIALVLAVAYALLILSSVGWLFGLLGFGEPIDLSPELKAILALNFISFAWRAAWRFAFTAREYGLGEGVFSILRIPVANIIAIMAGRRAFVAYLSSLAGHLPAWDKTEHSKHPVLMAANGDAA